MGGVVETLYRLSPPETGTGISCGINGVHVEDVPLLQMVAGPHGRLEWHPRKLSELEEDLSKCFRLPIDFGTKVASLSAVARALNQSNMPLAQIATLQMQIPDPPPLNKSSQSIGEIIELARKLQSSGMLKADWDPTKHPRRPAGSPRGIGGEFAPSNAPESAPSAIPAQFAIPAPAIPFRLPGPLPFPFEVVPPPVAIPDALPRTIPTNPFPDRRRCVKEWAEAREYCNSLRERGLLGKGDYRGTTKNYWKCVLGMISEDCGGNRTGA